MSRENYHCPLHPWLGQGFDAETIKRQGWRDQGILVVNTHDPRLERLERQLLTRIAERLYGRQEVSHG